MVSKGCHRREKKRRKPRKGFFEGLSREGVSRGGLLRAEAKRDSREVHYSGVSMEVSKDRLRSGASKVCFNGGASKRGFDGVLQREVSKGGFPSAFQRRSSNVTLRARFQGRLRRGCFAGRPLVFEGLGRVASNGRRPRSRLG